MIFQGILIRFPAPTSQLTTRLELQLHRIQGPLLVPKDPWHTQRHINKSKAYSGLVAYAFDPSAWEVEAGGSDLGSAWSTGQVLGQLGYTGKLCLDNKTKQGQASMARDRSHRPSMGTYHQFQTTP